MNIKTNTTNIKNIIYYRLQIFNKALKSIYQTFMGTPFVSSKMLSRLSLIIKILEDNLFNIERSILCKISHHGYIHKFGNYVKFHSEIREFKLFSVQT